MEFDALLQQGYSSRMSDATRRKDASPVQPGWLLFIHQIPGRPHYLRVKVGRRLREAGAVGIKNTVYVAPDCPPIREALSELVREVEERGGQALVCEARFVEGLSDETAEDLFRKALDKEYAAIGDAAKRLGLQMGSEIAPTETRRRSIAPKLRRLKRSLQAIVARDRFATAGRETASGLLALLEDRLQGVDQASKPNHAVPRPPRGATWVTRSGVMVDRIASAWLVRRFIDPAARFRFVSGPRSRVARGDLRFDMAGAEFTHIGESCTFEVLLERFRLRESALRCIADLVHDLDLEDGRYGRPETAGLGRMIVGLALATPDDEARLAQGATVFDGLYESFRRQSRGLPGRTHP